MKGRKPKPLGQATGHRTKAELAKRKAFVADPVASFDPPVPLAGLALKLWRELTISLQRAGVLADTDMTALVYVCQAHETAQAAYKAAKKEKDLDLQKSYFRQWSAACDLYRKFVVEYGLTPSSRTRIHSSTAKPKDELEAILGNAERDALATLQ